MHHLKIKMTDEQIAQLTSLLQRIGLNSFKDVFNSAISLLLLAVEEIEKGNVIASVNETREVYRHIIMPAFENIIPNKISDKKAKEN